MLNKVKSRLLSGKTNNIFKSLAKTGILLAIFSVVIIQYLFAQAWTQKADFGGGERTDAVAFVIDSKIYVGTGDNVYDTLLYLKDFWEYDPTADTWTQKADFSGIARFGAVGFSIGSKGYIGTGYKNLKDFWEYEPATDTWTQKADFGGDGRYYAVGFSIGSKGYIGTGFSSGPGIGEYTIYNDFWEYDPLTDIWTQKADFGEDSIWAAVGFSIDFKGYIGTGSSQKKFWEYDPNADTWTQKADFGGTERSNAVSFSIGSKGYIGTSNNTKDLWEFAPTTNTWTEKAIFPGHSRSNAVGVSTDFKAYIGTGLYFHPDSGTFYYKDFWEYDPENDNTGLNEQNFDNKNIIIYPDINNSFINIETTDSFKNKIILLSDINSKEITRLDNIRTNKVKINTENLNPGIYLIKIIDNDGILVKKFIKI